ncbi:MAG: helix-turn-helix domain-containing protein [Candidatus Velamenicoccus archaeovorus]
MMEKRYWDINELSEYLNVKVRTIYSWTFQNKIPCVRFGGKILRFDRQAIASWEKAQANNHNKNNS